MAERDTDEQTVSASATSGQRRPKVLYIMGAGRSGSTILGVTLGNCDGCFYAGELDKWLLMSGISMHERDRPTPTSGESVDRRLWSRVRENVEVPPELFGREARRCIEHSSSLFRLHKLPTRRRLRAGYRRVTENLYRAIADGTRSTHVVDSSHFPLRARQLQTLEGVELYLLFLVRDPRRVVASWERQGLPEPRFSMLATNAYLWLTHLLSVFVFLRHARERRLFVRYEDFIAGPEVVVREILDRVGLPGGAPDMRALSTGTPYHGNRLIFSEVVSIQREAGARPRRSPVTVSLQLPWALILRRLRPAAGG